MQLNRLKMGAGVLVVAGVLGGGLLAPSTAFADGGERDGLLGLGQVIGQAQSVGSQSNEGAVQQSQGNGNLNISPAIAILGGEASTGNAQGNSNDAEASVDQGNLVGQSQEADQEAEARSSGHSGGTVDQSVEQEESVSSQSNEGSVQQSQGNGNLNISPAIAILGGEASTGNAQGNSNDAEASVDQGNVVAQSQEAEQEAEVRADSPDHRDSEDRDSRDRDHKDRDHKDRGSKDRDSKDHDSKGHGGDIVHSSSQSQTVEQQRNAAEVKQSQGDGSISLSPAVDIGSDRDHDGGKDRDKGRDDQDRGKDRDHDHEKDGHRGDRDDSRGYDHDRSEDRGDSGARTYNVQGNANDAEASVWQANFVEQMQSVTQVLSLRR